MGRQPGHQPQRQIVKPVPRYVSKGQYRIPQTPVGRQRLISPTGIAMNEPSGESGRSSAAGSASTIGLSALAVLGPWPKATSPAPLKSRINSGPWDIRAAPKIPACPASR